MVPRQQQQPDFIAQPLAEQRTMEHLLDVYTAVCISYFLTMISSILLPTILSWGNRTLYYSNSGGEEQNNDHLHAVLDEPVHEEGR